MFRKSALGLSVAGMLLATAATAQTEATAMVDLNLRAGPGPTYEVLSVIPAEGTVSVDGCLEIENWCRVSLDGTEGWAYGGYLATIIEAEPLALTTERARTVVSTVTYEKAAAGTVAAGTMGAIVGALIGGPPGAALGAAIGLGAGAVATAPDTQVVTYVQQNPVETVYLDGEVVVGAGLPETVMLEAIPESEYRYVYVNGVPVLVDPADRRVVYIIR